MSVLKVGMLVLLLFGIRVIGNNVYICVLVLGLLRLS